MELNKLTGSVLLFITIGVLIGTGILVFGKFSTAAGVSTVVTNESFTMPAWNASVSLSNGNITTFSQVLNSTGGVLGSGNYSVTLLSGAYNNTGNNVTGFLIGDTVYAYYTYTDYDTATATSMTAVSGELSGISTNWLGIIIIVIIAAIVLGLVMQSFGARRRR